MIRPPSPEHRRSVTILGVTGSIGRSTVAVLRTRPELYRIEAVTAWSSVAALAEVARLLGARLAVIGREDLLSELRTRLEGSGIEAAAGDAALVEAAERPADWVMAAIVGAAGLRPTLAAVRRGAMVALANKECLVCAGALMLAEAARSGARLLPVDSEHNAIFQALGAAPLESIARLTLTASGGPFRDASIETMEAAGVEEALAHPNWSMGAKISIDSATMMNKGLELIEACHLFAIDERHVDILVHPQSIVHSLLTFRDGSTLAQLSPPDMRVPIAHALGWPGRLDLGGADTAPATLDLAALGALSFQAPDAARFPALGLARAALRAGGTAPILLNAANEVAVEAFLAGRIGFRDIVRIVAAVVEEAEHGPVTEYEDIRAYDARARSVAVRVTERTGAGRVFSSRPGGRTDCAPGASEAKVVSSKGSAWT
ncbi:MAG: 1-deoxy-D-xylulose-5-phosphate reductoisomerase [Geminicoccaceae bacterium]|nr:1-deoxy-D-xylulose-5-phosphate reductoisomerase [Geminicoccaceae bacterium]